MIADNNGATFGYDGLGRRVKKTVGATTYDFLLAPDGTPWDEYQATVHSRVTGGFFTFAYNTTYFRRTDHQGTPRVSTDYTGTVQQTGSNLPFGDNFVDTPSSPIIDFTGYAGGMWDSENNSDHFGSRDYAKAQGRWFTPDPAGMAAVDIANPQTWNRYAYVTNNPMSHTDPLGLNMDACGRNSDCGGDGGGGGDGCFEGDCSEPCLFIMDFCSPGVGGGGDGGGGGGGGGGVGGPGGGGPGGGSNGGATHGPWPGGETTGLPQLPTQPLSIGDLMSFTPAITPEDVELGEIICIAQPEVCVAGIITIGVIVYAPQIVDAVKQLAKGGHAEHRPKLG